MKIKDNIIFNYYEKRFNLELKGRITVIDNYEDNDKKLLCTLLSELKTLPQYAEEYKYLIYFNNIFSELELIKLNKTKQNKLYIIDHADNILFGKDDIIKFISLDRDNQYIIIGRCSFDLHLSPNYYAELKENKNQFYLSYFSDVKGWN